MIDKVCKHIMVVVCRQQAFTEKQPETEIHRFASLKHKQIKKNRINRVALELN